jgi:hypothetical protein
VKDEEMSQVDEEEEKSSPPKSDKDLIEVCQEAIQKHGIIDLLSKSLD